MRDVNRVAQNGFTFLGSSNPLASWFMPLQLNVPSTLNLFMTLKINNPE